MKRDIKERAFFLTGADRNSREPFSSATFITSPKNNCLLLKKHSKLFTDRMQKEVQDFLESSTIHGLAHISTARPAVLKVAWVLVVAASFAVAFRMISSSYIEWAESPVSTMVTSRPISDLSFPEVSHI